MHSKIRVWDPLVRIGHWSLVAAFTVAYLSGEEESAWHLYSGYTVLGLVAFRLLWGVIGSHYARFRNFVVGPTKVKRYVQSMLAGRPELHLGHNPAGGWMIVALLVSLAVTCVSGLKVYALEEGKGPFAAVGPVHPSHPPSTATAQWHALAGFRSVGEPGVKASSRDAIRAVVVLVRTTHPTLPVRSSVAQATHAAFLRRLPRNGGEQGGLAKAREEFWEEIHESAAEFTLFLVFLHLVGVGISSVLEKENLVKAMITGDKIVKDAARLSGKRK